MITQPSLNNKSVKEYLTGQSHFWWGPYKYMYAYLHDPRMRAPDIEKYLPSRTVADPKFYLNI